MISRLAPCLLLRAPHAAPPPSFATKAAPSSQGEGKAAALSRAVAVVFGLLLALLLFSPEAAASWLTRIMGAAEQAGSRAAKLGSGPLDHAAAHVKSLPVKAEGAVLAAQATQEGHWRFVNRSGETLTAGTPDEMKRVAPLLLPEAKGDVKLSLYVTEDSIFLYRGALKDLPAGTELNVVVGTESYRVLRRSEGTAERLYAEVRPSLFVEITERKAFEEVVWQLARPLNNANVRMLALEPGGPPRLASAPRLDPATQRALVDVIDPASLPAALGSVRGQTVLVTGRVDGKLLYVQPSSGPERSLLLEDLLKAAEDADVNLVVLHASSTPRQPGGRNWLWQKVQVKGLDQALGQPRVADFLSALAGPKGRFVVSATPSGSHAHAARYQAGDQHSRGAADAPDRRRVLRDGLRSHGAHRHRRRAGERAQRRAPAGARPAVHPRHPFRPADRLSGVHRPGPDRLSGVAGLVAPHLAAGGG